MDLSGRRTDFITGTNQANLDIIFADLVQFFGESWLTSDSGGHRLQLLVRRRDPLSTIELLLLADAISACKDVDKSWLADTQKKIKIGDLNQQNGALSELLFLGSLRRATMRARPAPVNQKGYDATIRCDDGVTFYLSIKRFGQSSPEKEFIKRARGFVAKQNNRLRGRTKSIQIVLAFKKYPELSDWNAADVLAQSSELPVARDTKDLLLRLDPIGIPDASTLAPNYYSYRVIVVCNEHQNEQVNFIDKVRQAASELERKVPKDGNSHTVLLVRVHNTARISRLHKYAETYLQDPGARIDGIVLYQPYVARENENTVLVHTMTMAWSPHSSKLVERMRNHPIKVPLLIGRISTSGPVWQIVMDALRTVNLEDCYIYQDGEYFVHAMEQPGGALGHVSNPAPGIRQHLVSNGLIIQGIFPESEELEVI